MLFRSMAKPWEMDWSGVAAPWEQDWSNADYSISSPAPSRSAERMIGFDIPKYPETQTPEEQFGMSALAKYYTHQGYRVAGYDKTPSAITKELEGLNVFCLFEESEALLQDLYREVPNELLEVVYTPAVPMNSCNVTYFLNRGLPIKKRSEVLGQITRNHKTIAIAGTHGKTTTTTLVTHLLKSAGCNITSFMGGLSANYNTNYISGNPSQDNHWMIVEADEFDRSFHQLEPDYVILTSMDADHLDIYNSIEEVEKSYQQFIDKLKPNGTLIVKNSVNNQIVFSGKTLSYDLNLKVHYSAGNIHFTSDASSIFDFNATDKTWKNLDRKSTRLNSSHTDISRMPSSA